MKIHIADPQARMRFSLRILLEQQSGWEVCCEAADCDELIDKLRTSTLDLLLIDLDLPDIPAENLLHLLRREYPELKIIAMSGRQEIGQTAMNAGADAFACKADSPEKLLQLIRELQNRQAPEGS